jgi:CRISPR-associated endoribonuclease Cas6/Csy4 subtype I-F
MFKHYLEIVAQPYDNDLHFIINKVFNRLHGIISQYELNLGLSFPKMSPRSPGEIIRVFGVPDQLQQILDNHGIMALAQRRMVFFSEIREVPLKARPIVYLRFRKPEKVSKFKVERTLRRLRMRNLSRGESWVKGDDEKIKNSMLMKADGIGTYPFLLVERGNSKFPIYIRREKPDKFKQKKVEKFSRYGLGNGVYHEVSAVFEF